MPNSEKYRRIKEIGEDLERLALNVEDDAISGQLEAYGMELSGMGEMKEEKEGYEEEGEEMSDKMARRYLRKKVKI